MSATNPFQIPSCFQASQQQRRRDRFKKGVITAVALLIALLVGLLIQGCVSQHAEETTVTPLNANSSAPQTGTTSDTAPAPAPTPSPVILMAKPAVSVADPVSAPVAPAPVAYAQPVSTVSTATQATVSQPDTAGYTVKRGDTLARIARAHRTTVKAIQIVNGLATDRIIIGEKLKLPQV